MVDFLKANLRLSLSNELIQSIMNRLCRELNCCRQFIKTESASIMRRFSALFCNVGFMFFYDFLSDISGNFAVALYLIGKGHSALSNSAKLNGVVRHL